MTLLGQFALWVALLLGTWGAVLGFSGRWHDRPALADAVIRSVYGVFALLVVASVALWKGLVSHDFNIEYVAAYTSRNLPAYYIFSAFWAGQKGSLLFWAIVLASFAALAQWLTSPRHRRPDAVRRGGDAVDHGVLHLGHGVRGQPVPAARRSRRPTAGASTRSCRTSGW